VRTATETPAARATAPPVRIVLADDAYLVREALKHLLGDAPGLEIVGECEEATAVEGVLDAQRADVLITDIRMPPSGEDEGIRLAARLRESHPALGVVVLSTYVEVAYALKLLEQGSDGRAYLLKDRIRERAQVVDAVRAVASGGSVIDPRVVEDLIRARSVPESGLTALTQRETETLALLAEGRSNAAIADALVLTKRAVEKHVNAIFAKLELGPADEVDRRVRAALLFLVEESARAPSQAGRAHGVPPPG
jgi:DNA-binding NarL/FixJ family response regulator